MQPLDMPKPTVALDYKFARYASDTSTSKVQGDTFPRILHSEGMIGEMYLHMFLEPLIQLPGLWCDVLFLFLSMLKVST